MDEYKSWTVFLDRDGVINKKAPEHEYIKTWDEFEFIPGSIEAIAQLNKIFGRVVVVSNQQGLGKGIIEPFASEMIWTHMLDEITRKSGGTIDAVLYCPHSKEDRCGCRKPEIGLATRAKELFPEIDFQKSVVVGDSFYDMLFGSRLGAFCVMLQGGVLRCPPFGRLCDAFFETLYDFSFQEMLFSPRWKSPNKGIEEWLK